MGLQPNPTTGKLDLVAAPAAVQLGQITGEPMGCKEMQGWNRSYNHATRTLTMTPIGTQEVFVKGKKFTFSAPIALQHPDVNGGHFYFWNESGVLSVNQTPFDYENTAHAAFITYDNTQTPPGFGFTETHGVVMDWATHEQRHKRTGTYRDTGGILAGLTIYQPGDATNPSLASIQPDTTECGIYDEDLPHTLAAFTQDGVAPYAILRKLHTTNKWAWNVSQVDAPYLQTANVPQFNPASGGDSLVNITDDAYVAWYEFGLGVADDADSQKFRTIWIPGQTQYVPALPTTQSRIAARDAALAEGWQTALDLTGLPFLEIAPLNKVVLHYSTAFTNNAYRLRAEGSAALAGSREQSASFSGILPTIHGNLSGRSDPGQHPASAISTQGSTFAGALNVAVETSSQLALERLSEFDYLGAWAAAKAYRVGNMVLVNGGIYRCTVAHTSAVSWATDAANWDQVSVARHADVTAAETASGKDGTVTYVASTDTFYRYLAAGSSYVRNGTSVLNTAEGGTTRRVAVAGRYNINLPLTSGRKNLFRDPDCQFGAATGTSGVGFTATNCAVTEDTVIVIGDTGKSFKTTGAGSAWSVELLLNPVPKGLKNRQMEVFLTAQGTSASNLTFKVEIGGVIVAQMTGADKFVLDANNPKKFSLVFPAGDLTNEPRVYISGTTASTVTWGASYAGEPVSVTSGGITTPWQSYPTTVGGLGNKTATTSMAWYRRVGDALEMRGRIATNNVAAGAGATAFSVTIPAGLSYDTTKMNASANIGWAMTYGILAAAQFDRETQVITSGTGTLNFIKPTTAGLITQSDFNNTNDQEISWFASVPISGWQATDIVTPEASLVERAYNTSTWDSSDTTTANVGYGVTGAAITGPLSGSVTKRVRFQTPIQQTDDIVIKFAGASGQPYRISAQFIDVNGNRIVNSESTAQTLGTSSGVYWRPVTGSPTDIDVVFARYASLANDDLPAQDWQNNWRWLAEKVPNGQMYQSFYVQGPVKAGETGTAIPAGYAGNSVQTQVFSGVQIGLIATQLCSVAVTPGNYLVLFEADVSQGSATRITSSPGQWTGGTAAVTFPGDATAWDWQACRVSSASAIYAVTTARVTSAGTVIIKATASGASTSADARGRVTFILLN